LANSETPLPLLLSGPMLRRVAPDRLLVWLAATRPLDLMSALTVELAPLGQPVRRQALTGEACQIIPLGRHAYLHLLTIVPAEPLPLDTVIEYNLAWSSDEGLRWLTDELPWLLHPGRQRPSFVIAARNHALLHGSCRKPHFDGDDALVTADRWLGERLDRPEERPAWLLLTGDQIYTDDVAGPMLVAIHRLMDRLGLVDEALEGATVADSQALLAAPQTYYRREELLPGIERNVALRKRFFGGVKKPVFTAANAHNHLITLSEVVAMYLLAWSPLPWQLVDLTAPALPSEQLERYQRERPVVERFAAGLSAVARLFAHQPTLMIFDDHDVTDDWNLTAEWEATAYGHPFSRRIIGNALLGYLLCQAWGNDPERVAGPLSDAAELLATAPSGQRLDCAQQDGCIQRLLRFHQWDYQVDGGPSLLVLDTRTRRWRNERRPARPSGLMDWESLTELQQSLLDHRSAVIVTPTPMFGVKLIETIQKLFTLAGKPLLVDAENWMAHRGTAQVLLNIFRHSRTPGNYVVLSGDVHYSFVYDIQVRDRRRGPQLWQITSSGIKNGFPRRLLDGLDRLNRWLYAPWSPLNWFTKRRAMHIEPRDPDIASAGERLWNGPGIGLVRLAADGRPADIRELDARGMEVCFPPSR
jgi:hypothetical protein